MELAAGFRSVRQPLGQELGARIKERLSHKSEGLSHCSDWNRMSQLTDDPSREGSPCTSIRVDRKLSRLEV